MRRLFIFLIAAFAASFLWATVTPTSVTHAAPAASWKDSSTITYEKNDYSTAVPDTVKSIGLPDGDAAYTYVGYPTDNNGQTQNNSSQTLFVIFFDKGVDVTTAKTAKYETLDFIDTVTYKNPTKPVNIDIDPTNAGKNKNTSECSLSGFGYGIGWIVCPVTKFIAFSMDYAYKALSDFLVVRPIIADSNSALFTAWNYMRNFANVAFVIAFLIIIYSQLTNFGISNYGLKKLLPRLIIAALLVNLSYYICAIAVDISNVLGYSIRDVFTNMSNGLAGTNSANFNGLSFENLAGFILSGGTTAAVGVLAFIEVGGLAGAAALLIPTLVSGLMALLVALLIMAGRQALITVFIIISPLAFVAYLLPNTEKWFEKWRSSFMTMLIIFPAFSIIFGGSQLASEAIIRNADSINMVILGMFVKVAPLFITPLLLKLGGPMLNSLANLVNKPNSLITGAAKKYGEDLQQTAKAKWLANDKKSNAFTPQRWARSAGRKLDHNKRDREFKRTAYGGHSEARWKDRQQYRDIDRVARSASTYKTIGEGKSEAEYLGRVANLNSLHETPEQLLDMQMRAVNESVASGKADTDFNYDTRRTSAYQNTHEFSDMSTDMKDALTNARTASENIAVRAMGSQAAKSIQQLEVAKILKNTANVTQREIAGAKVIDPTGAGVIRAEAAALSAISKAETESLGNQVTLLSIEAQERGQTVADYSKTIVENVRDNGASANVQPSILEAAVEAQLRDGNLVLAEELRMSENIDQSMLSKAIIRNADDLKKKGGFMLQKNLGLNIESYNGDNDGLKVAMNSARLQSIGGTSANNISGIKFGYLQKIADMLAADDEGILTNGLNNDRASLQAMYDNFMLALEDEGTRATIGDRIPQVMSIVDTLKQKGLQRTAKPTEGAGETTPPEPDNLGGPDYVI